jgi:uncharacterized repeat protein (TIGR03803 family)
MFAGLLACISIIGIAPAHAAGVVFAVDAYAGKAKILHRFHGRVDGKSPFSQLTNIGSTLYGTTWKGGGGGCGGDGCGTVFSVDRITHAEKVLYAFTGGKDGGNPQAGLIKSGSILYGTATSYGAGHGVVFAFDLKSGRERVVHAFNYTDGDGPFGKLLLANGVLFGTTAGGGASGEGVVFSLDPATGAESVVYSFGGGGDGTSPLGSLIGLSGTLYGTTSLGGSKNRGTVFGVSLATGAETYRYSFRGADGAYPGSAGLTYFDGLLFGTTDDGGAFDSGIVFTVDPASGNESVLYSFGSKEADGLIPNGNLVQFGGNLYGTTLGGGSNDWGTVFSITPAGDETVLYSFTFTTHGITAGLRKVHSRFYGTASE